jgi:hypothetical protein
VPKTESKTQLQIVLVQPDGSTSKMNQDVSNVLFNVKPVPVLLKIVLLVLPTEKVQKYVVAHKTISITE